MSIASATFVYRGSLSYSIPFQLGELTYTPTAGHDYAVEICYFALPFPTNMVGTAADYDMVIRVDGIRGMALGSTASDAVLVWSASLSGDSNAYAGWRFLSGDFPENIFTTNQQTINLKLSLVDHTGNEIPYTLDPTVDRPLLICLRTIFHNQ